MRTRNLTKRYGSQYAVWRVDLDIDPGLVVGVVGPSGSGKTTTVRLMTGAEKPTSGTVSVFGVAPSAFRGQERARIGYMPQLPVLYPHLSLDENLQFVASVYGMPLRRQGALDRALDFVELSAHRRKLLRQTSGGMQRRLALAAVLLHDPDLLFLDEPTAGIDPVLRRKFWSHFERLKDSGRTLIVTTQYVGEAAFCDLVAVLARGRLLTIDSPEGLRRQAYGGHMVDLRTSERVDPAALRSLRSLPFVLGADGDDDGGRSLRVVVRDADTAVPRLQEWCASRPLRLESIRRHEPPFDDVFVSLLERVDLDDDEG